MEMKGVECSPCWRWAAQYNATQDERRRKKKSRTGYDETGKSWWQMAASQRLLGETRARKHFPHAGPVVHIKKTRRRYTQKVKEIPPSTFLDVEEEEWKGWKKEKQIFVVLFVSSFSCSHQVLDHDVMGLLLVERYKQPLTYTTELIKTLHTTAN